MFLGNTPVEMKIISRIPDLGQKKMCIIHETKIVLLLTGEETLPERSRSMCVPTMPGQRR